MRPSNHMICLLEQFNDVSLPPNWTSFGLVVALSINIASSSISDWCSDNTSHWSCWASPLAVLTANGISFSTSTSAHFIGFGLTSFYLALSSLSYFLSPLECPSIFLFSPSSSQTLFFSGKIKHGRPRPRSPRNVFFDPAKMAPAVFSLVDRYPTMNLTLRGDRDCVNGQTSGSYRVWEYHFGARERSTKIHSSYSYYLCNWLLAIQLSCWLFPGHQSQMACSFSDLLQYLPPTHRLRDRILDFVRSAMSSFLIFIIISTRTSLQVIQLASCPLFCVKSPNDGHAAAVEWTDGRLLISRNISLSAIHHVANSTHFANKNLPVPHLPP